MPSLPVSHHLSEFAQVMSIESVMPFNHLILHRLLRLLHSVFPSTRVFSSELAVHIRYPNYWSFSFISSSSNKYRGLISFRIDWFDLFVVQVSRVLFITTVQNISSSALLNTKSIPLTQTSL